MSITSPIYCPCYYAPYGYSRETCQEGMRMARFTGKTPEEIVYTGPENYQGFYGNAYMLGFPSYQGGVVVKTIPSHDHLVPSNYEFGIAPGTPLVLVGNTYSPYFQVLPAPADPDFRIQPQLVPNSSSL